MGQLKGNATRVAGLTNRDFGTNYHVTVQNLDGINYKQLNSATRNGNDSTTNISDHAAYAAKYPTNTAGWTLVNGVLTSPKNQ
jgi:hypothetical protein